MNRITHKSYETMGDTSWETGQPIPDNGVVHVHFDHIGNFFKLIQETDRKYVLISSNSDYGLTEQINEPVERDMSKYLRMVNTEGMKYATLVLPARCNVEHCCIEDKYSVKMYSFTNRTFNSIPNNIVKWFATNCNIDDERIIHIPFGIAEWSKDLVKKTKKTKFGIYVNFQHNTLERAGIENMFREIPDTLIESNVSHHQFIERLKEYPFIISPPGNGYDCFRTLESIYCGSLPIIVNDIWSKAYDNLPCIKVNTYVGIYHELKKLWEKIRENDMIFVDNEVQNVVYWFQQIQNARQLLIG